MVELLPEILSLPEYTATDEPASQKHKLHEITSIIDWIQCFSIFIVIISCNEFNRIPDLIGYQNLIIQASIQYHKGCRVVYNRRFCLKAFAATILERSTIDITVWKLAFPEQLPTGGPYGASGYTLYQPSKQLSPSTPSTQRRPVCLQWNKPLAQNALTVPVDMIIPATDVFTPVSQTRITKQFFVHTKRNHPVAHPAAREDHFMYHRTTINNHIRLGNNSLYKFFSVFFPFLINTT